MNQSLAPITLERLKPFPLPKALASLPQRFREEFASSYELVKGYTQSLEEYVGAEQQVQQTIDDCVATLNRISALLAEYHANSSRIADRAEQMDKLYKEFLNLETYQYQLLSSNYNENFLKVKLARATAACDYDSDSMIKEFKAGNPDGLGEFLVRFKDARKTYHERREKLNRWNEERVSGFI